MSKLDEILAAEAAEVTALAGLKAAVDAVPVAIQALKDQLSTGNPIQPADLDKIIQSMQSATAEVVADTATLTTAVAPDLPPTPPPTPVTEPTGGDVPPVE